MPHDDNNQGFTKFLDEQDEADRLAAEKQREKAKARAIIQKWTDKIKFARIHDEEPRKRWAKDRKMARGDSKNPVTANLIGSIIEVLAAFLYAKNPDISIRPSESVNRQKIKIYRDFAKTVEIVVSRLLVDAGLKRLAKKWVRASMTVGISWLKVALKTRKEPNVLTERKINDLQEQINRIKALQIKADDEELPDSDATLAEIDAQIIALQSEREIDVAEGAVLDVFAAEDIIIAPECGDVENYIQAPWIGIDLYKTMDQALEITGWESTEDLVLIKTANTYTQRPRKGESEQGGRTEPAGRWISNDKDDESTDGFLRCTEIWSKVDGVVYTMIDGITTKWARQPYSPVTGKRWYPIFDLPAHLIDGERYPQSDVFQLTSLQNEYGAVRSNKRIHRQRAVPGMMFNMAEIDDASIKRLTSSEIQEYTGVNPSGQGADLNMLFVPKIYNPVDPALYETLDITVEMEKISGAQDALQSSVRVEKTATEARIEEAGFGARSGARRDTLEDSLTEAAEYLAQLALQVMDQAAIIEYAGPDAVWMELTTNQALMMFNLTIKAGSTGKPKAASDRELWGTLLPLIEKLIERIGQARIMGQEWAAAPWIALLAETMLRLDDPANIEDFLPVPPPPEPEPEPEPTELEKAEIEKDKAAALLDRASVIEKVPELFTEQEARLLLLFGGEPGQQSQQPAPEQIPTDLPIN